MFPPKKKLLNASTVKYQLRKVERRSKIQTALQLSLYLYLVTTLFLFYLFRISFFLNCGLKIKLNFTNAV